jgi:hypothetical protein
MNKQWLYIFRIVYIDQVVAFRGSFYRMWFTHYGTRYKRALAGVDTGASWEIPEEVAIIDKTVSERINLIQQLEEEDTNALPYY